MTKNAHEVVAALEKPRTYTVDRVEYERYSKIGKPDSVKVTYWCGPSTFSEWLPILDERSYVKKHYIAWCWQRGCIPPAPERVLSKAKSVVSPLLSPFLVIC